jgi:hypothetical protein
MAPKWLAGSSCLCQYLACRKIPSHFDLQSMLDFLRWSPSSQLAIKAVSSEWFILRVAVHVCKMKWVCTYNFFLWGAYVCSISKSKRSNTQSWLGKSVWVYMCVRVCNVHAQTHAYVSRHTTKLV